MMFAAGDEPRQERRRDRHGRGLRGPLATRGRLAAKGVPLGRRRSPGQRFDDIVLDAVERLEARFAEELRGVEFAVEDVPNTSRPWVTEGVPLGATITDDVTGETARIVVFRRPIELRTQDPAELAFLVRDVVVEQVADLLDLPPDEVDADYGLY